MTALRLYKLLSTLASPLLLSGFVLRSLSHSAYRNRLNERFGFGLMKLRKGGIVVHGASVGEIIALKPFIESLITEYKNLPVTVTTFTPTGSERVTALFGSRVQHCYLPLDIPLCVNQFLKSARPQAVVIMETEIWPSLIDACHRTGVSTLLINGRISSRSFPRYQKFQKLMRPTLAKINHVMAQSNDDAQRFIDLGALPDKVSISGNIKYDLNLTDKVVKTVDHLKTQLNERPILVVGSSHHDEEQLIFDSYAQVKKALPELLMVLAPRHPERIPVIENIARKYQYQLIKRSAKTAPENNHDIWLVDTMGELLSFYGIGDVCVIAGSFGATGGHNPLEAALFAKPMIMGSNTRNFNDMTQALVAAGGAIQLASNTADSLATAVIGLLQDTPQSVEIGSAAQAVLSRNQGATSLSISALRSLMSHS